MTEEEWLTCDNPERVLEFLRGKANGRKLRLFAAVCQRDHHRMQCGGKWDWTELTEQFADGKVTLLEWNIRRSTIHGAHRFDDAHNHAVEAVLDAADMSGWYGEKTFVPANQAAYLRRGCQLLRDIFGNPFRKVNFNPAWRTSDVLLLAQGIYADRAFDRMPILADALQDAGCDNVDILNHCREPNATHVRGCWVVDLVLGKE